MLSAKAILLFLSVTHALGIGSIKRTINDAFETVGAKGQLNSHESGLERRQNQYFYFSGNSLQIQGQIYNINNTYYIPSSVIGNCTNNLNNNGTQECAMQCVTAATLMAGDGVIFASSTIRRVDVIAGLGNIDNVYNLASKKENEARADDVSGATSLIESRSQPCPNNNILTDFSNYNCQFGDTSNSFKVSCQNYGCGASVPSNYSSTLQNFFSEAAFWMVNHEAPGMNFTVSDLKTNIVLFRCAAQFSANGQNTCALKIPATGCKF